MKGITFNRETCVTSPSGPANAGSSTRVLAPLTELSASTSARLASSFSTDKSSKLSLSSVALLVVPSSLLCECTCKPDVSPVGIDTDGFATMAAMLVTSVLDYVFGRPSFIFEEL